MNSNLFFISSAYLPIQYIAGAIGTSSDTVFGSRVRFTCPEGQVFATGVEVIDTTCMPGGKWSQSYIPKCQEVWNFQIDEYLSECFSDMFL